MIPITICEAVIGYSLVSIIKGKRNPRIGNVHSSKEVALSTHQGNKQKITEHEVLKFQGEMTGDILS